MRYVMIGYGKLRLKLAGLCVTTRSGNVTKEKFSVVNEISSMTTVTFLLPVYHNLIPTFSK